MIFLTIGRSYKKKRIFQLTVACMKHWGLRASSLSADTNADVGHYAWF